MSIDWKNVDEDISKEISRLAEVRLSCTVSMSISSLQRAMSFASVTAGAATASIGAGISAASGSETFVGLTYPSFSAALFFLMSCIFCLVQARPIAFDIPGALPDILCQYDDYIYGPKSQMYGWNAENYQEALCNNEILLKKNGRYMTAAIISAVLAPISAFITYLVLMALKAWVVA